MRLIATITIVLVSVSAFSQQIPQYSQYIRNPFMVNPGAAGIYDFADITLSGRWQWIGFGDEPRTAYLSGSVVLGENKKPKYNPAFRMSNGIVKSPEVNTGKLKHALGGQLLADQYGAFRRMNVAGTYAIHLPVSKDYNLSFGTRLGFSNNTFLQDKAVVLNTVDPLSAYAGGDVEYDDFISGRTNKFIMDVGAGFYFYSKKLFVGISADHLTKDLVEFGSGTANFNTQLHYNLTAGIKIPLNEDLTLMPAILVKNMQPAPFSIEGTLLAEYKEWLWLGTSYRHTDAVIIMFGFNVSERFKFGYSYDYSLSRMNKMSSGGHELVLGLMLR